MGGKERRNLLSRLALGQIEESPFSKEVGSIRRDLDELVKKLGIRSRYCHWFQACQGLGGAGGGSRLPVSGGAN